MRSRLVAVFIGIAAGAMFTQTSDVMGMQGSSDRSALGQLFAERVGMYVALHREVERLLPPEIITPDPEVLFAPRVAMNREMRLARPHARQGDIFAPALEVYFRGLIAGTLQREGIRDLLVIIEDENDVRVPAAVNGDYPAGRSVPAMPPCLLAALPPLPTEVRYSFVGRDLILWDMHAGLIVDFVPRAVPVLTTN